MKELKHDIEIFQLIFQNKLPEFYSFLLKFDIHAEIFLVQWFLCLYTKNVQNSILLVLFHSIMQGHLGQFLYFWKSCYFQNCLGHFKTNLIRCHEIF
jgi:hypothetical protein